MKLFARRWATLFLSAVWVLAAAGHCLSGTNAWAKERPAPAAALFLERLQQAVSAVSGTPLHTWATLDTVFFESADLPTRAGNLRFSGRFTADSTDGAMEGVLERWVLSGGRLHLELKQPARIRGAVDGRLAVEGMELEGPFGHVSATLAIAPEGAFELAIRLMGIEPSAVIPFLDPTSSGRLDAELELRGDWQSFIAATGAAADITVSAGRLRTDTGLPPVEVLHLNARLDQSILRIRSFEGLLGGAPFRVAGRFENPWTLSENGFVDLSIAGDNLLLYRTERMGVRVTADLHCAGPFSRFAVKGTLAITEGRYEKDFGLLEGLKGAAQQPTESRLEFFSIRWEPLRRVELDVAVSASAPFMVTNNRVRTVAYPELQLTGTGEKPVMTGHVALGPTTVYVPAGRLYFESGVLRFEPPDPSRPLVEMVGGGRLQGYDVRAIVEGPYDQPTVTLSSSPALPDEELLLLVLSGQAPASRRAWDAERSRHLDVAVHLGKEMVGRLEGSRSNDTVQSIMDRFEVAIGHSSVRSGEENVRVLFRVASGIFRQGDTLYLAGEKDPFGYFNGGVRIAFRFR